MFLSNGCKSCRRLSNASETFSRYYRWIIALFMAYLYVGVIMVSGEKATSRTKGIRTTRDITHENDNYRTRIHKDTNSSLKVQQYSKNFSNFSTNVLLNNHRKALFDRAAWENGLDKSSINRNISFDNKNNIEFTSAWAIRLPEQLHGNAAGYIDDIARQLGLSNHGSIGHLKGHYLLVHHTFFIHTPNADEELREFRNRVTQSLEKHPHVEWVQHEKILKRKKRSLAFKDEFFPSQWHLDNLKFVGHDINVTGVWEHNITGKGVTVSVIDDGVEWDNPDILDNYSPEGSWDLNSNDADPMPRVDDAGLNHHGTRCAGEIAAVANEYCAVGVAFGARVSGIRILDGPMTDSLEAMAFNTKSNVNDIYSCSWGPDDNGRTVDGPHQMAQSALAHGVLSGRHGYGSIFVVASGNGGHFKDNCNFDGYANSIFTVTIGAVDELGQMPYYAEQCAAMLAVTYSSGQGHERNIVTTDWRLGSGTGCTDRHTGTSAAAPLAAGIIALMLEARPCLTWRDVQHIIVYTSVRVDIEPEEWQVNGAGLAHSHKHGFGLLDSWRLVTTSKMWTNVPFMTSWSSKIMKVKDRIPILPGYNLTKMMNVTEKMANQVTTLEHVTVTVNIRHPKRGALVIKLISPFGTISRLASLRKYDKSKEGFTDWTFSTVKCWGEIPQGLWKLVIADEGDGAHEVGLLKSWRITFYGSMMTSDDVQDRKKLVKKAVSGRYLRKPGPPCPLPPNAEEKPDVISPKVLKIVLLMSGFFFLMGMCFVLETLCHNPDRGSNMIKVQDKDVEQPDTQYTIDVSSTEGFNTADELNTIESYMSSNLSKDDEQRLSNIIEHGTSRPNLSTISMIDLSSLDILEVTHQVSTPDEEMRIKEFEERMSFALEQSLKLQQIQIGQIDNLQKECQQILNPRNVDIFAMEEEYRKRKKQNKPKKLKGILKKPKQYKE